nr:unnamed protein product [Callosobruchus chinensis]
MVSLVDVLALEQHEAPGDGPRNLSLIDAPIDELPELVNRLDRASLHSKFQEVSSPSASTPAEVDRNTTAHPSSPQALVPQPPGKDSIGVGIVDDIPANSTFQGARLNPSASPYAPMHSDFFAFRWSHIDIGRWNVKYNGRSSVTDCLERVDELRIPRGVSKERFFQSAVELFTQVALLWYRTASVFSWDYL